MLLPIFCVDGGQFLVTNYQEILGVFFFRGLREIEGSCDHRLPIDDHYLVVCNGVLGIYSSIYLT